MEHMYRQLPDLVQTDSEVILKYQPALKVTKM